MSIIRKNGRASLEVKTHKKTKKSEPVTVTAPKNEVIVDDIAVVDVGDNENYWDATFKKNITPTEVTEEVEDSKYLETCVTNPWDRYQLFEDDIEKENEYRCVGASYDVLSPKTKAEALKEFDIYKSNPSSLLAEYETFILEIDRRSNIFTVVDGPNDDFKRLEFKTYSKPGMDINKMSYGEKERSFPYTEMMLFSLNEQKITKLSQSLVSYLYRTSNMKYKNPLYEKIVNFIGKEKAGINWFRESAKFFAYEFGPFSDEVHESFLASKEARGLYGKCFYRHPFFMRKIPLYKFLFSKKELNGFVNDSKSLFYGVNRLNGNLHFGLLRMTSDTHANTPYFKSFGPLMVDLRDNESKVYSKIPDLFLSFLNSVKEYFPDMYNIYYINLEKTSEEKITEKMKSVEWRNNLLEIENNFALGTIVHNIPYKESISYAFSVNNGGQGLILLIKLCFSEYTFRDIFVYGLTMLHCSKRVLKYYNDASALYGKFNSLLKDLSDSEDVIRKDYTQYKWDEFFKKMVTRDTAANKINEFVKEVVSFKESQPNFDDFFYSLHSLKNTFTEMNLTGPLNSLFAKLIYSEHGYYSIIGLISDTGYSREQIVGSLLGKGYTAKDLTTDITTTLNLLINNFFLNPFIQENIFLDGCQAFEECLDIVIVRDEMRKNWEESKAELKEFILHKEEFSSFSAYNSNHQNILYNVYHSEL